MREYKEILKLAEMLKNENIPFEMEEYNGGYHINYPNTQFGGICSVIEHDGSIGRNSDLLEIMGLMTDEEIGANRDFVLGNLTAENVFNRIKKDWEEETRSEFEKNGED